ncbi:MAG TPA: hypothetical protein DCY40_03445 [Actinobacteria bacterium]|nr:hypothetical protein [Actinomycetota bacterium]
MIVYRERPLDHHPAEEVAEGPDGWADFTCSFRCACGESRIQLDEDEADRCVSCGRVYRLHAFVTVESGQGKAS